MNEPAPPGQEPLPAPLPRPFPLAWQAIGLLVLLFVLEIGLALPIRAAAGAQKKSPAVGASVVVLAHGIVLFLGLRKTRAPAREVFPFKAFHPGLVIGSLLALCGAGLLLLETGYLISQAMPKPDWIREIDREMRTGVGNAIRMVLIGPILEELLFRGLILRGFLGNYPRRKALLLSALMFALFHINPWQIPGAFVLGVLFGWWRAETGSLWPSVLGHMFYNAIPVAMTALSNRVGRKETLAPLPDFPIQAQLIIVALGAVLIGLGILLVRRFRSLRRPLGAAGAT